MHAALLRARMLGDAAKVLALEAKIREAFSSSSAPAPAPPAQDLTAVALTAHPARERPTAVTASSSGARVAHGGSGVTLASSASTLGVTGDEGTTVAAHAAGTGHHPQRHQEPDHSSSSGSGRGGESRKRPREQDGSSAASRRPDQGSAGVESEPRAEVVSSFDARGMPIRSLQSGKQAPLEKEDLKAGWRRGKHTTHVDKHAGASAPGAREAWLPEDSEELSLAEVVRRERETGSGDFDRTLARNVMRGKRTLGKRGSNTGADEDDDAGDEDLAALATSADSRLTGRAQQEKDMTRAVAAHRSMGRALESCWYCFDGQAIKKHLILSLGEFSFLMMPPDGERVPGQLCIVPLPHLGAMTDADEEVYDEVNKFKAAVTRMLEAEGQDALFLETAMHFGKKRHTRVDVIPMDREEAMDAPIFFRKAIMDAEEETSNHKLLDTAGKGLRRVIPKGFSYFHVGWQGGGFVHPIEDEETFSPTFGIDTAAGMLGLPPGTFGRTSQRRTFEQERQAVLAFLPRWEPFDWTRELEGGS